MRHVSIPVFNSYSNEPLIMKSELPTSRNHAQSSNFILESCYLYKAFRHEPVLEVTIPVSRQAN